MTSESGGGPVLRSYIGLVGRRKWWIAAAALLGLAASLGLSLTQARQYSATAQILVQSSATATQVQTDIQLVTSAPVEALVRRELGSKLGSIQSVTAAEVAQTNVIAITAIRSSPAGAALAANAYGKAFVGYLQGVATDSLMGAEMQVQAQIHRLGAQLKGLRGARGMTGERAALLNQQAVLRAQLEQMQVSGSSALSGGLEFVTPARPPSSPSSPKPVLEGLLGVAVGLVLGLAFALLRDSLDETLSSTETAEQLGGSPVLAMVPMAAAGKKRDRQLVVSVSQPLSPAAESYRSLRTSLQFARQEHALRTVVVTSPAADDGKTATVANLGAVFAQAGERVVLVSCDLRRPRLARFFGLDEQAGLTAVLLGERSLDEVVQPVGGHETLWLLGAGKVPANPAELLAGPAARDVFAALRAEFDLVLIDSPPVLPVTDAAVLSKEADGTLMVVSAGQTRRADLRRAADKLAQVNAPLVGTVLTGVTGDTGYGYGNRYKALNPDLPQAGVPAQASGHPPAEAANGTRHARRQ